MRLPDPVRRVLHRMACRVIVSKPPDLVITHDPAQGPKMERWVILKSRLLSIYVHAHWRDDDARALHDHRAFNVSILLDGLYGEVLAQRGGPVLRIAGDVIFRRAATPHRLMVPMPAMSLWIKGPDVREWGFRTADGWVPWQQCVDPDDPGKLAL